MKDLTIEKKAELACQMAISDAIEKAQENKNDTFELMKLKVKTFLKTPAFQKNADQYLEIINNHEF
tara:strand:- start:8167 stop:8364 length:198 start_codon:yes stop_codon:yes gene_type:complete